MHVDEKWFYLMQVNQSYILQSDELPTHPQTKTNALNVKQCSYPLLHDLDWNTRSRSGMMESWLFRGSLSR